MPSLRSEAWLTSCLVIGIQWVWRSYWCLTFSPAVRTLPPLLRLCLDKITRVFGFLCGLDLVRFKGPVLLVVVVIVVVFASCEVGQAFCPPGRASFLTDRCLILLMIVSQSQLPHLLHGLFLEPSPAKEWLCSLHPFSTIPIPESVLFSEGARKFSPQAFEARGKQWFTTATFSVAITRVL